MRARNHSYIMDGCSMQLNCEQDYIPVGNGSIDANAICHNGSWSLGERRKSLAVADSDSWLKCEIGSMSIKVKHLLRNKTETSIPFKMY